MGNKILKQFNFKSLMAFVSETYLKNRTIVTSDIESIFSNIEEKTGINIVRHKFPTGSESSTWIVPKQWDVKEAWLKDKSGKIIASYKDHPLFVCIYSKGVHTTLSRKELCEHTYSEVKQPDAYAYNWRFAMDYKLQLKDWGISLPLNIIKELKDDEYEIKIDIETKDGEMLIGEIEKKGQTDNTIVFLSDYCHPGQVNDSYSGLIVFLKVMGELFKTGDTLFNYRMLMMPETIGSAFYLTKNKDSLRNIKGAIFSEMVGWGDEWYIKKTRRGDTYLDLATSDCQKRFPKLKTGSFYELIGNDEYMFDSIQAGIPSISVQKNPFIEYHTSNDEPSKVDVNNLEFAESLILHIVYIIENDKIYKFKHTAPFWMTRFNLYADDQYEPEDFMVRLKIVYDLLDGKNSILDISDKLGVEFVDVKKFIDSIYENNLIIEVGHPLICNEYRL